MIKIKCIREFYVQKPKIKILFITITPAARIFYIKTLATISSEKFVRGWIWIDLTLIWICWAVKSFMFSLDQIQWKWTGKTWPEWLFRYSTPRRAALPGVSVKTNIIERAVVKLVPALHAAGSSGNKLKVDIAGQLREFYFFTSSFAILHHCPRQITFTT